MSARRKEARELFSVRISHFAPEGLHQRRRAATPVRGWGMRRYKMGAVMAVALSGLFGASAYAFSDDLQTILSIRGPLMEMTRSVRFPVDGSVSQLLITTELCPGATATLFRPDYVQIEPTDPDVKLWSIG